MRLGQLARKLATRPSDIVDFMSSNAILTEEGTNTKLSEDQVRLIVERFAPDMLATILGQESVPEPIVEVVFEQPLVEETPTAEPESAIEIPVAEVPANTQEETEKVEVIKAPKVELAGLKVLGKIELPEPKKKVQPIEETDKTEDVISETPEKKPYRENKPKRPVNKDRREYKPRKNPIALQREREAHEAAEKKRELERLEKERKTNYYLQRVKGAGPSKPARLYEESVEDINDSPVKKKKEPTTWFGKFWKWYTS